jgi:hypothetical protein
VPEEKHRECWWLILRDGTAVAGDGALSALKLSPLVDAGDKFLAKYRKHLGRFVPEGPAPRRYP